MVDQAVAPAAPPQPLAPAAPEQVGDDSAWWRTAVIYEVYIRSFADGNGDGIGDLAGVRSRLPYLRDLGVDAIWFAPGTCRRRRTGATTSRTIAPSTRCSETWPRRSS